MIIRAATEQDIPSIVQLLKLSLGESLMPKSEAFWKWKHIDNPFGKSPVLVAEENNQLIGVRAFMRWEWKQGDTVYKAVRAVDTATHPQHQGKGIFKKLTLQLVEQCKAEGVDFIFNTPNASSKPGYLKMGWQELGRLKIYVKPLLNFKRKTNDFETNFKLREVGLKKIQEPVNISTRYSPAFLNWRYGANPNITYYVVDEPEKFLVIFRLKQGRIGVEFRICEWLVTSVKQNTESSKAVFACARQSGASFITFSGTKIPLHAFPLGIGPMVTIRPLSLHNSLSLKQWKPSLGDMEVF